MADIQDIITQDCPYTQFPTAVDNIDRKVDVDLRTKALVDQYYAYLESSNFEGMMSLLENNPTLKQTIITSEDWNKSRDGLIAVQRVFLNYISEYLVNFSKPKGTWNKDTKYEKYNVVTYETSDDHAIQTFIAMPSSPNSIDIPIGTLPTDTNYWTCITLRGAQGVSGTGMSPQGVYQTGKQYYKDDLVSYNNALWFAIQDNVDQTPNTNSQSWQLMMTFSGDLLIFDNSNTTLKSTTVNSAITELSNKMKCIKNVIIPSGGFINNVYTYRNSIISASYEPRVNFMEESIPIAMKSQVIVQTYDGYMTFKVKKIPTTDLKIETIMLTATY